MDAGGRCLEVVEEETEWNNNGYGGNRLCWMSPRVSFSQDLAMADNAPRLSPEKRKWEQSSSSSCMNDDDQEFEFRMPSSSSPLPQQLHHSSFQMLSADQLFINGKLRPLLHLPFSSDDLCLPSKSSHLSRHLSIDSSPNFPLHLPPSSSRSVGNSRCSSPSRIPPPPPIALASPKAKYSAKIKEFFKPKRPLHSPKDASASAQLSRDNSVTSSCRLPISPRSFWPFSRSNSAGESKTTTPAVPALPRRSNSTGESKTTSTSKSSDAMEGGKPCGASSHSNLDSTISQGKNLHPSASVSGSERKKGEAQRSICVSSTTALSPEPLNSGAPKESTTSCPASLSPYATLGFSSTDAASLAVLDQHGFHPREFVVSTEASGSGAACGAPSLSDQSSNAISTFKDAKKAAVMNATRVRGSGSPGRVPRRRASSPSVNFARGSPGRRGVRNGTEGKDNTGKIMLRNLERCSAEAKLGVGRSRDGSNAVERKNSYPVAVRVTPVLNVAIYRGKASSKPRLFSLGKLFSSKREKPMEARVNNWRNGA